MILRLYYFVKIIQADMLEVVRNWEIYESLSRRKKC